MLIIREDTFSDYHIKLGKTNPTKNIAPAVNCIPSSFLFFFFWKGLRWTSHRWFSAAAETEGLNATQTGDQRGCYKGLHRGG